MWTCVSVVVDYVDMCQRSGWPFIYPPTWPSGQVNKSDGGGAEGQGRTIPEHVLSQGGKLQ